MTFYGRQTLSQDGARDMDAEMRNNKSNQSDCNLISNWNSFFFFFIIYFAKNCVLTNFTETIKDKCLFDRKVEIILYTLYIEGLCEEQLFLYSNEKRKTRTHLVNMYRWSFKKYMFQTKPEPTPL